MDIEITEIIPPKNASDKLVNEKRKKNLQGVMNMIKELGHIDESNKAVTNKDFIYRFQ